MNEPYILSRYCVGATALKLRDYLREHTDKLWLYRKVAQGYPPKIRWGNSDGYFEHDTIYNKPELIDTTSHKIRLSKLLAQHDMPVITFQKGTPEKFPIVIRKRLAGQGGEGIVIVENYNDWLEYKEYYYSYFIPFEWEVRVHSLGGNPVKILKKELFEDQVEDKFPIRNNDNKYHYRRKDMGIPHYASACQLAHDLYKIFPMNMIGWDMGYYKNKYYVIEGNSAPSLNSLNVELYGKYLLEVIGG